MVDSLTNDPAVAQILRILAGIVLFGLVGAGYTLYAAYRNGERWQSAKAKTEIATLGLAGAAAGIYVMFVGADIGSVAFGAAAGVAGHIVREVIEIYTDTRDRYDELSEKDLDTSEAAFLALKHGLDQNEPEEALEAFRTLMAVYGKPSVETAEQSVEEIENRAREEGAQSAVDSLFPEEEVEGGYHVDEDPIREEMREDAEVDRAGDDATEEDDESTEDIDDERRAFMMGSPTSEKRSDEVVRDGP